MSFQIHDDNKCSAIINVNDLKIKLVEKSRTPIAPALETIQNIHNHWNTVSNAVVIEFKTNYNVVGKRILPVSNTNKELCFLVSTIQELEEALVFTNNECVRYKIISIAKIEN